MDNKNNEDINVLEKVADEQRCEADEARRKAKRLKTIIICVICGMVAFSVLGMVLLFSISEDRGLLGGLFVPEQESETQKPIKFHEVYPDAFNIFEYDEYMGLDRIIYYCDPQMGTEEGVAEKDASSYGEVFEILYKMINAAIRGDHKEYNRYLGGKQAEEAHEFTQQQIYNIKLTHHSIKSVTSDNGKVYQEQVYIVEYMINENNGTFRDDIGSNESRKQYYVFTDESGEFKLMDIVNMKYIY